MKNRTAKVLKEMGLKVTPQRQSILAILEGNKNHPSADSIYRQIREEYPAVSFATVYNTLSKLAETGRVQELDIDPGKKRFDPCTAPHYHFYCRSCGSVFDILSEIPSLSGFEELCTATVDGHYVDTVHLNFKGTCENCAKKRPGKRRPGSP